MFEGTIIDQLIAAVEQAEDRLERQAATVELAQISGQAACEASSDAMLAGVA
jgi:hypothetical protein